MLRSPLLILCILSIIVSLLVTRPHSKSLLTADYADNTDKYQFFCDQMVKHSALGGSA